MLTQNIICSALIEIGKLLFPETCLSCDSILNKKSVFCPICLSYIKRTDHFRIQHNSILQRVSMRQDLSRGMALFDYVKEGEVQKAIHKLKYDGKKSIGKRFGDMFGESYQKLDSNLQAEYIIPIPADSVRKRKRGFNQAAVFAKAISNVCRIPVLENILQKTKHQKTLTLQSRTSRFEQMKNNFFIQNPEILEGKRILLVDDVLTTGATMEAASKILETSKIAELQWGLIAIANF